MNLNKVFVLGNVTRDPESRALPSGQSVTSFSIATNRFYTDRNGEKKQEAEFHNISAFGKLADISAQYLTKGSLVLIEGRIRTRSWQDASGNKRFRTEIIANNLQLGPRSAIRTNNFSRPAQPKIAEQEEIPIIEESSSADSTEEKAVSPEPEKTQEQSEPKTKSTSSEENPISNPTDPPEEEIKVEDIPF